jgi:hypothetical protein
MLEEVKEQAAECIRPVREKGVGTIHYDWFLSSDNTRCEIREPCESSEAVLVHQSNLSESLRILFEKFGNPHSLVIYGNPSQELLENAVATEIDITLFFFLQDLQTNIVYWFRTWISANLLSLHFSFLVIFFPLS